MKWWLKWWRGRCCRPLGFLPSISAWVKRLLHIFLDVTGIFSFSVNTRNAYPELLVLVSLSRFGFPTIIYIFTKHQRHCNMEKWWFKSEGCLTDLWSIFEQYLRKAAEGVKNRIGIPWIPLICHFVRSVTFDVCFLQVFAWLQVQVRNLGLWQFLHLSIRQY